MNLQQIAAALGGEVSGNQVLAPGPGHSPNDRSMSVSLNGPEGLLVNSFAGDDWQACKDYIRERLGIDRDDWKTNARKVSQPATVSKRRVAEYVYTTADGTPVVRAVRTDPKDFFQERPNSRGGWELGGSKGPKVPYRLPDILKAVHDVVFIVEGEKDANALANAGFVATCNIGGAGKWTPDLNQHFAGKTVYILPDNDEAGAKHARQVFENLQPVAASVKIVLLPGLPEKGDVSDWIADGGNLSELLNFCERSDGASAKSAPNLIVSSGEFVTNFTPPDYLIDGLVQRRFCYSITGPTGSGKTSILLLIVASIGLGKAVGEYPLEKGRVLYLAGENPDDVRMRWLALADTMDFDPAAIDVHFLPGTPKLSEIADRIRAEVDKIGPVSLVVVDTSAAYFEGDEENANVQAGVHARRMRSLVTLPGEPCVLVACHPTKNASQDALLPRGGGAFIAEVDGNLTCWKNDSTVTLHWQGKFRGPDFAPITFSLNTVTTQRLKDSRGRLIPTVVAKALSERERSEAEANSRSDEDALLVAISENDRASFAGLASVLQWLTKDSKPYKARVQRSAERLKKGGFVKVERNGLTLTEKGKAEAKRAKYNSEAAGASYG